MNLMILSIHYLNRIEILKYILTCAFIIWQFHFAFSQETLPDTSSAHFEKQNSFTSIFYGQPGKAALYSLLIPGAGQVYNRRIWKVPIIYGIEGLAAYNLISNIRSFQDDDQCWRSLVADQSNPDPICGTTTNVTTAFNQRQSSRSQKEIAWVLMGVAHLFNVIEAFVDRHLINFDTSETLSYYHSLPLEQPNLFQNPTIDIITIRIPISTN